MADIDTLKLVGQTVAGKYAVEAVVGEGGFATVYKATHLIWKRPVALKVFKALGDFSAADRQKLLDEFVQEGALLADLSARTAAIVQARDIAMLAAPDGAEIPYMVLEWLEGATLEAVLNDEVARGVRPRTMAEAVRLIDAAAEALALAHRKGVAHRDVKPGNIFVLGEPRGEATVKLLDFGIAKVASDAQKMAGTFTKTGGQVTSFTPAYGAPEQFSRTHGSTGPWTDVFALALIVVEMVTGKAPLQGDDFVQLAVAAATPDRRPTPRALGATVTDAIEAVFARALAVKPADRFQSAGDFWNALRRALHMDPMRAMTDPLPAQGAVAAAQPIASAPTIAAVSRDPRDAVTAPAVGNLPAAAAAGSRPTGSRIGLLVGAGAVAVVGIVLTVRAVGGGTKERGAASAPEAIPPGAAQATSTTASAPPAAASSAAAVASSAAPAGSGAAPTCPAGMLPIPGGSFYMGSDDGLALEKPAHQVTLAPFCMDEFEVTTEDYKACSGAGRCKRAGTTNDWSGITEKDRKAFDPLCNVRDPVGRAKHPINCVDWEMAEKFCREQGKHLPTEAQWEFAARGPDGRRFPWGDDDPGAGHLNACGRECVAWGQKNGVEMRAMYDADDGFANTAPVGSFPKGASRYGVQDVVGNVWEWVSDWYGEYGKEELREPTGPAQGEERVIRGGAWNGSYPAWVRPTFRYKDAPSKRGYGIGFRCAR